MKILITLLTLVLTSCTTPEEQIETKTLVETKKLDKQWRLTYIQNDGQVYIADIHFKHKSGIEYTGIVNWNTGLSHNLTAELTSDNKFSMVTHFPYKKGEEYDKGMYNI